ncbi:hypothetical protein FKW77_009818 [Venturia effusa]|uniref:Peptidase C15, pyroglutamyl peptidase I-like protein n=1 Tax=Venturia effusa TaxID=50376 RepID=A0A517L482_9PEZI|nr:hypothetical protein FKW77_009818 [Venturia effusa]
MNNLFARPTKITLTAYSSQPYLDTTTNPSFEITRRLPKTVTHAGHLANLYAHPSSLPIDYHGCAKLIPKLLAERDYDIVLHIGLDVGNSFFHVEKGAEKEGYHQCPDDLKKVITKTQNKMMFGKAPTRLESGFELDEVLENWKSVDGAAERVWSEGRTRGIDGCGKIVQDLRVTNDVGGHICGFVYYTALKWYWEREHRQRVAFLHVPMLEGQAQVAQGVDVVLRLIKALCEHVD